jgi:hypothetical protein
MDRVPQKRINLPSLCGSWIFRRADSLECPQRAQSASSLIFRSRANFGH